MKRRSSPRSARWLVAALVVLGCLIFAAPALAHSISGTVTSFATGQPVFGAELQLWKWSTTSSVWVRPGVYAVSSADGTYALSFNDDGQYRVQCYNTPGFAEQWWYQAASIDGATTITVPGDTLTGIDFALTSPKPATSLAMDLPATCAYRALTVSGHLTSGTTPLAGKTVVIKYADSSDMGILAEVTTNAAGLFTYPANPAVSTTYQAVFEGDGDYAACDTPLAVVLPRVYLTKPTGPAATRTTTTFTAACYLKPRHTAGTYPVTIQCQRSISGKWVTKKTVKAKATNYSTYTKCAVRIRLGTKGTWRIRSVHARDAQNAMTTSAWRTIKVT
jgi:hypothetical protein